MKKTIFLFILCLFGCGYNAIDFVNNPVIIKNIESGQLNNEKDSKGCYYYVYSVRPNRLRSEGYFFDKCGKYTVGDTVVISKK